VLLKSDLDVPQTHLSKGWFVEQELILSWSLRYEVCHAFVLLKSDLSVKNTSKVWRHFNKQKFVLSSNFRCDKIYKQQWCDFGPTLVCDLSKTLFNKLGQIWGTSELDLSSTTKCDQIIEKMVTILVKLLLSTSFCLIYPPQGQFEEHLSGTLAAQQCDQNNRNDKFKFGHP
jgi:hypothetical protein